MSSTSILRVHGGSPQSLPHVGRCSPRGSGPCPRLRRALLALLTLAACACSAADPDDNLHVAARGLYTAAISRNGNLALVASLTQGASLWDLDTRQRRFDWNHRKDTHSAITAVAFSPDGSVAATSDGNTLVLWDARKGGALRYFSAPAEVQGMALTQGGALALLGLRDGTALLMDAKAGGVKRRFVHDAEVLAVAMDASGRHALTGSADGSARLWDVETGAMVHRWEHGAPVQVVALSEDGTRSMSAALGGSAVVRDSEGGQALGDFTPSAARLSRGEGYTAAEFSADGATVLLGTVDGRVVLADASTAHVLENWQLPRDGTARAAGGRVSALGFTTSGPLAASGDGFIHRLRRPSAR